MFSSTSADALLSALCLAATAGTFRLLEQQKISIVPIISCISFGFSMAMLGTAVLRYRGAQQLEQYQVTMMPVNKVAPASLIAPALADEAKAGANDKAGHQEQEPQQGNVEDVQMPSADDALPPVKKHLRVLSCVLQLKQRGAAGGYNATARRALLCHIVATLNLDW